MVFAHSSQSKKQKFPVQTPMNRKAKLVRVCHVFEFVTDNFKVHIQSYLLNLPQSPQFYLAYCYSKA